MSENNPLQYTSRTFNTILNDINSDSELAVKPNWWKRIWAGVGDVLNVMLNAIANNIALRTAFTRQATVDLLELIDYTLSPQEASTGNILFYINTSLGTGIFPFLVSSSDLVAKSQGSLSVSAKPFEARADVNFTLVTDTFTANAGTDELTISTDLIVTGHKIRVTTAGTLPVPLQAGIEYYVIYVNATTVKLAVSLEDALAGNAIDITTAGAPVNTLNLYSKEVTVYQQETLAAAVVVGTSDGITEWQEFDLPDKLVLEDTLTITVNSITWIRVDTFVDSISTDKHYKVLPKSDDQFKIRFGDGTYGKIPEAFDVEALYSFGGGSDSNITSLNRINVYGGSDTNLNAVSNTVNITGGADEESLSSAKRLGPLLLKARNRFVTVSDGEALVLANFGVSLTTILKNEYGVLSCKVTSILNGGGDADASLGTSIEAFLIARTVLEEVDVRHEVSTITSTNVTSAAKMLSGFVYANVAPYFELAYQLFLTETGQEIKDKYDSEGIAAAVTLINTIFTATFGEDDYDQITVLLDDLEPRDFGDTIQESDVFAYVQSSVDGIDYMTIAVFGTGLPLSLATDEITTNGVLTLTEIP